MQSSDPEPLRGPASTQHTPAPPPAGLERTEHQTRFPEGTTESGEAWGRLDSSRDEIQPELSRATPLSSARRLGECSGGNVPFILSHPPPENHPRTRGPKYNSKTLTMVATGPLSKLSTGAWEPGSRCCGVGLKSRRWNRDITGGR